MPFGRRIWLVMAVAVGLTGCKAGSMGSLSMLPRRNPSPVAFDLDEFVAEHNRNAEAIESLKAKPTIVASRGRLYRVSVDGRMALERPRNFKLVLEAQGMQKADIGSNAEEFWFWMANPDKEEKWIYWCNYRDLESSDLPVTYQPDWIIEAMGLKPITPEEARGVQVRRGPESGTTRLVFATTTNRGEPYSREMIVSNSDHRIKRLQIFTPNPRMLIAEAQAADYQAYPPGSKATGQSCYLPQRLKLEWKREQVVLDVALGQEVQVNQFDHAMGADIFVEPEMTGYTRMNLAELSRGDRNGRRTRTRQTMPPPESGDDIQLGRPAPLKDDGPVVPKVGRRTPRPSTDGDGSPLPTLEDLVGAPVSRPPNSGPVQSASLSGSPGRDLAVEQ